MYSRCPNALYPSLCIILFYSKIGSNWVSNLKQNKCINKVEQKRICIYVRRRRKRYSSNISNFMCTHSRCLSSSEDRHSILLYELREKLNSNQHFIILFVLECVCSLLISHCMYTDSGTWENEWTFWKMYCVARMFATQTTTNILLLQHNLLFLYTMRCRLMVELSVCVRMQ